MRGWKVGQMEISSNSFDEKYFFSLKVSSLNAFFVVENLANSLVLTVTLQNSVANLLDLHLKR